MVVLLWKIVLLFLWGIPTYSYLLRNNQIFALSRRFDRLPSISLTKLHDKKEDKFSSFAAEHENNEQDEDDDDDEEEEDDDKNNAVNVSNCDNFVLPWIPGTKGYKSGKCNELYWQQNSDLVCIYLPIDENVHREEVQTKFESDQVVVSIKGEEVISLKLAEKVIASACFWLFETAKDGRRYLQLDLEKKAKLMNWAGIRLDDRREAQIQVQRSEMLEKLYAANQGISKLTGAPAQTMEDMQKDKDLMRSITTEVDTRPRQTTVLADGTESTRYLDDEEEDKNVDDVAFDHFNRGDDHKEIHSDCDEQDCQHAKHTEENIYTEKEE